MQDQFGTDYSITPSKFVNGITYGLGVLFIVLGTVIPYIIYLDEEAGLMVAIYFEILIAGIGIPVYYFSYAYSPKKYITSEKGVTIIRSMKDLEIPIEDILKVEEKDYKSYKMIRKMGNGGLFSVSGKFWTRADGTFWAYGKNNNWVMIYAKEKWAVSPDEKELFITDLKGRIEKYQRHKKK
jgi:hypothetical protein